jgi:hypothetical protein
MFGQLDASTMTTDSSTLPPFFDQLTPSEQCEYHSLRHSLSSPSCKSRRNKSNETFQDLLDQLKRFVGDSPTRGLVCGIAWLDRGIAMNTHHLSLVTHRCKSSLNGSFQALGYGTIPSGADVSPEIQRLFPCMKGRFGLLRQWTIRQRIEEVPAVPEEEISPAPEGSLLNDEYVASYLNEKCTLAQMVQAIIRGRRTAVKEREEEVRPVICLEDDVYAFAPKDEGGFFDAPWC